MIGLIVITSDVVIAAGVVRDVITAIGQHLVVLGSATWHIRSTPNPVCTRCQRPHGDVSWFDYHRFPALKDNAELRSGCAGGIIY
jgi:hypothetical protein